MRRLERELVTRGASVERSGIGVLTFKAAPLWRTRRPGILLAISSGRVSVSAGAGGPRRVRYDIRSGVLQTLAVLACIALLALGLSWPRLTLINSIAGVWIFLYAIPWVFASRRFQRLVYDSAAEIVERRSVPRGPLPPEAAPDAAPDAAPGAAPGADPEGDAGVSRTRPPASDPPFDG